jgi:hypothetical protein
MIITFILAFIGVFGTLTIVACLRQVEEGLAEIHEQIDTPICPVCHIPHHRSGNKKMHTSLRGIRTYYKRKKRAAALATNQAVHTKNKKSEPALLLQ